jgi:hypothetical protein
MKHTKYAQYSFLEQAEINDFVKQVMITQANLLEQASFLEQAEINDFVKQVMIKRADLPEQTKLAPCTLAEYCPDESTDILLETEDTPAWAHRIQEAHIVIVHLGRFGELDFDQRRGELTDTWIEDGRLSTRQIELPMGSSFVVLSNGSPVCLYVIQRREIHWLGSELRRRGGS